MVRPNVEALPLPVTVFAGPSSAGALPPDTPVRGSYSSTRPASAAAALGLARTGTVNRATWFGDTAVTAETSRLVGETPVVLPWTGVSEEFRNVPPME